MSKYDYSLIADEETKYELQQQETLDLWKERIEQLEEENKKLKEIIRKAKEFEYSDEQMHYIFENTRDLD